jgi:hypothetical protein
MPKFITLAGKKQVGKDTSASIIKKLIDSHVDELTHDKIVKDGLHGPTGLEPRVHIVHFADALKDACVLIFGINRQDMETEEGKKKLTDICWPVSIKVDMPGGEIRDVWYPESNSKFMTVREVLQFVGTDLFRNQMDPDVWVKSVYRKQYWNDDIVIVADCRFPNEAAFAKQHGLLVRLDRNNGLGGDQHVSERALDSYTDYDAVIDNNGHLDELEEKWAHLLRKNGFIA